MTTKEGRDYTLSALIEALTIFRKYRDDNFPTGCEHDELRVYGIPPEAISLEDQKRLVELHFIWEEDTAAWLSTAFGSA